MILARKASLTWSDSGVAGIQTCQTWTGAEGDGGCLARLEAGARFPRHAHHGWAQILVLEGAIRFDDGVTRAGDMLQVQGSDAHEALALEGTLLFVAHRGGIDFVDGPS
ncbi:cupin domain-containing protein [Xanthobacter sp. V4C-4]|uniref:cupin domain-containing protein n=1 Tax=Xanthobacter cornucopiae TaxID=3119924 RepID=UPI0037288373